MECLNTFLMYTTIRTILELFLSLKITRDEPTLLGYSVTTIPFCSKIRSV